MTAMRRSVRTLTRLISEVESAVDWVRFRHRRDGPFRIVPYRGHGTTDTLYVRGRVLEGKAIPPASEHDSAWRNLANTVRRLETDEVPAARVRVLAGEATMETVADEEGYFEFALDAHTFTGGREVWRAVDLELLDPVAKDGSACKSVARVLVPPEQSKFGVISDIDDTVVKTDVTNLLRMLRLVFLTNAWTRLPFEGVAAFYRALHRGDAGETTNPIFYVSSSPWNLYDLLHEVFEVHGIPAGPLFLKDYGIAREVLLSLGHREHKLRSIEHILETHPGLPFVLVGDSGQQDPEIYYEVARRYPGRIRVVYIREVSVGEARDAELKAITAEMARLGVEMLCVADTVTAARHAVSLDLIDEPSLAEVAGEKRREEQKPGPLESMVKK
jgi:phosphatidate phosphatase APP1